MCICICVNRNDKTWGNVILPFGYNSKDAMFIFCLKRLYGLIINSNVKCIFWTKHVWVYGAHFESLPINYK